MRVAIEVSANNGSSFPDRNYSATVRISGVQERHGSNVITRGLVEAAGKAAVDILKVARHG